MSARLRSPGGSSSKRTPTHSLSLLSSALSSSAGSGAVGTPNTSRSLALSTPTSVGRTPGVSSRRGPPPSSRSSRKMGRAVESAQGSRLPLFTSPQHFGHSSSQPATPGSSQSSRSSPQFSGAFGIDMVFLGILMDDRFDLCPLRSGVSSSNLIGLRGTPTHVRGMFSSRADDRRCSSAPLSSLPTPDPPSHMQVWHALWCSPTYLSPQYANNHISHPVSSGAAELTPEVRCLFAFTPLVGNSMSSSILLHTSDWCYLFPLHTGDERYHGTHQDTLLHSETRR